MATQQRRIRLSENPELEEPEIAVLLGDGIFVHDGEIVIETGTTVTEEEALRLAEEVLKRKREMLRSLKKFKALAEQAGFGRVNVVKSFDRTSEAVGDVARELTEVLREAACLWRTRIGEPIHVDNATRNRLREAGFYVSPQGYMCIDYIKYFCIGRITLSKLIDAAITVKHNKNELLQRIEELKTIEPALAEKALAQIERVERLIELAEKAGIDLSWLAGEIDDFDVEISHSLKC